MEDIIIHSDLNNFYATVEKKLNPLLRDYPVAVCGNPTERRGIVLAKSEEAKACGVKTGDAVWEAKRKCPDIVIVSPHFDEYMKYSRLAKAVYARYTDLIESYGIDECWLDISHSTLLFPEFKNKTVVVDGEEHYTDEYLTFLGDTVRNTIKAELGVTVSCGVSFNKAYAKLASDLKKPDGTTVISKVNHQKVVYGLPVEDLLFVGKATEKKLKSVGIFTIGQLAKADDRFIEDMLGKSGMTLLRYARGLDDSKVKHMDDKREYKSIGNSCTYAEDIKNYRRIEQLLTVLSESVAARLREAGQGLADTVHLFVRYSDLSDFTCQTKVRHTELCSEIAACAFRLFKERVKEPFSIRALGVSVSGFDNGTSQLTVDELAGNYKKKEKLERVIDEIRKKHGYKAVQRGLIANDPLLMRDDIKNSHLIKPANFEDRGQSIDKKKIREITDDIDPEDVPPEM